ncbi:Prolyl oligopeptidase family protein [Chitinophaga terrae (ex Kim and Jung 2007)]|uniref:Prolyl oligopeptidase family protein n=3 Tax=Chitinophaga terrae (ex Kim and Jung 2007) TaxID=408074 RepID=A0A1H3X908_9BACT|nr:Prolyl oligopeptidase family protein [Chitinophaga terrae (ex Kim and Jung 2007)]
MLKCCCFLLLLFCSVVSLFAQKKLIDSTTYKCWTQLRRPILSDNGQYASYLKDSNYSRNYTLIVKSTKNRWNIQVNFSNMIGIPQTGFVNNSKCLFYKRIDQDSLNIIWLGGDKRKEYIVTSFFSPKDNNDHLLLYQNIKQSQDLILTDLNTSQFRRLDGINGRIVDYKHLPSPDAVLLVIAPDKVKNEGLFELKLLNLTTYTLTSIIGEVYIEKYLVGRDHLIGMSTNNDGTKSIWKYSFSKKKLTEITPSVKLNTYQINLISVSKDDKYLFFEASKQMDRIQNANLAHPDLRIWRYVDEVFPPKSASDNIPTYRVENYWMDLDKGAVIMYDPLIEYGTIFNRTESDSIFKLPGSVLSGDQKYLIYNLGGIYWSYELATGIKRNITEGVNPQLFLPENGDADYFIEKSMVVGLSKGEPMVIISDGFDLWLCSLNGHFSPNNITNGYGRKNRIKFSLLGEGEDLSYGEAASFFTSKDKAIFIAFNKQSKKNGFFQKSNYLVKGDPELLSMDDAMYWIPSEPKSFPNITSSDMKPFKARKSNVFLVAKSTSKSSVNYFVTNDFKRFKQISFNYPEKRYTWMSAELMSWKRSDGIELQGVLYKPENFDSTKKYPVIFYFYRKASDNLNSFMVPKECPGCIIDIPLYVSNGYMVFTPDIYFTEGETGKSALESVLGSVRLLSSLPYIDSNRLGVQGCSFSGFTTNYIITHTNVFSAACSASGLSDFISGYNSVTPGVSGSIKQRQFEDGPYQMGGTLWEKTEAYIENSAVLRADRLTTPLLLMHTTNDGLIPISNAVEFFLAARRAGKKVWLLEYGAGNDHNVFGLEGKDFNRRMMEFFDYYLKDRNRPDWLFDAQL